MRKWFLLMSVVSVFVGCKSDEQASDGVKVSDGQDSFSWSTDVRSQDIQLTGNGSWKVTSDADCQNWCYPVKESDNSSTIPLWVSPNITNKARSGKVTVTVGGKSQTINVSQPAFSGDLDKFVYYLPVVFHVLYKDAKDEKQNAKEEQFKKILTAVNKLYADNKMNVVFEMAEYDKDGEKLDEPGIIRHQVDFDELDAHDFLGSSDDKYEKFVDSQLNLKKCVNIYVFPFTQEDEESTSLGLTTLPIATTAHSLEGLYESDEVNDYAYLNQVWGVCVNSDCINEWQDENTVNTKYIVSTVAHELGHYLGLLHTFSENECEDDDYCDDTHVSDYNEYVAYIIKYIEKSGKTSFTIKELATRTDCMTGEEFVAKNILDYTYTYNEEFTSQQFARTRHVLKYSPLVPGPKLVDYNTTGKGMRGMAAPPSISRPVPCPKVPVKRIPSVFKK